MTESVSQFGTASVQTAPASQARWSDAIRTRLRGVTLLRRARRAWEGRTEAAGERAFRDGEVAQKTLVASWRQLYAQGVVLPLDQVGFSRFSEFEEDGFLLYVMTLAGARSRAAVEISAQDGRVCMATNLVVHHRWRGFLFDADPVFVADGRRFFARHPATRAAPPVFEARWFTRENVDALLAAAGVPAEIDVLSLDIDGNDLHLWSALEATRPRVLIAEFNNAVPGDRAITVPYRPDFAFATLPPDQALFRSASLEALVRVSRRKGYRLVGFNALGFNALFLRDDVLPDAFPERPASDLDHNPFARDVREKWWPKLRDLPWLDVPEDGRL